MRQSRLTLETFKLSMTDATYPFQVVIKIREQLPANRIDKVPHVVQLCSPGCQGRYPNHVGLSRFLSFFQEHLLFASDIITLECFLKNLLSLVQLKDEMWCPDCM